MALIYCGIDEAGYGPMLGPLCVGFSAFRVEDWDPEGGAPDLWTLLENAVGRRGRDSLGRVPIADSKKLKLSNQSKTRHPLTHLERGVLAFAGLVGDETPPRVPRLCEPCGDDNDADHGRHGGGTRDPSSLESDEDLFAALGVRLDPHPWYAGDPAPLPLAGTAGQLAIARNKLALACAGAGVEPLALACIAVGETEFNDTIRTGGSKAHCTGRCFARYLRRVVERWGGSGDEVRLVCDRHGGRTGYTDMIEAAVRGLGCGVETLEESDRCSRYAVQTSHATSGGRAFQPAASVPSGGRAFQPATSVPSGGRAFQPAASVPSGGRAFQPAASVPSGGRAFQPAAPSVAAPQSAGVSGPMGVSSDGESEEGSPPPSPLPPGAGGGAGEDAPRAGRIHVQFRPEAEEAHLPVALASMTAKLVRELAMARFNRYWCGRVAELKPTAGYVQDARRWLEDLEGVLCDDEREAMVRMA